MHWLFYKFTCWILRLALTPFVKVRVLYAERIPSTGACILAANHISHFDPPLISCHIRRKVDWMAMAELFKNRFLGKWLTYADTFPVNREKPDRTAIKTALLRLKRERMLGLFPEGGIRDGVTSIIEGAGMKPGLEMLARMSNSPVLPCVILGSDFLYAKSTWRKLRSRTVYVAFGELLPPPVAGAEAKEHLEIRFAESLQTLCKDIMNQFNLPPEFMPKPAQERFQK